MLVECLYKGKPHLSGDSWRNDEDCSDCYCNYGVTSCKPVKCDLPLDCHLARATEGSDCCPVCAGKSESTFGIKLFIYIWTKACHTFIALLSPCVFFYFSFFSDKYVWMLYGWNIYFYVALHVWSWNFKGCVGSTGIVYNNTDVWNEDACTTCECVQGRAKCHASMCQTTCLNPRHVSGECCPRCESQHLDLFLT